MHLKTINLRPIEPADIELVAGWLGKRENYQWLNFGHGHQRLDAFSLRIMCQRDLHLMRIFTADDYDTPIGVVALSDIDRNFRTASIWGVLGEKEHGGRRVTTRAASRLLTIGFEELGLRAINAWTLENNEGARRLLEGLNFRLVGRQRRCHTIDGQVLDRLWFDLLAEEHEEL